MEGFIQDPVYAGYLVRNQNCTVSLVFVLKYQAHKQSKMLMSKFWFSQS